MFFKSQSRISHMDSLELIQLQNHEKKQQTNKQTNKQNEIVSSYIAGHFHRTGHFKSTSTCKFQKYVQQTRPVEH